MLQNETEYFPESYAFHGSIPIIMGTKLDMIVVGTPEAECRKVWNWLCIKVESLDAMLNRFAPESEISRVNKAGRFTDVAVSKDLAGLIRIAMDYWKRTDGLFDITKGWMREISLSEDGKLSLNGHEMDFGGFAKGYVLKDLRTRMLQSGISSAFVDFGDSSIMTIGHHPFGRCWRVGVKDPFGGAILGEVELTGTSMSTSGNTPSYSGHIVNPKTKEAETGRKVVTIVSEDPLDAEVLSTATILADDAALKVLRKNFDKAEFYIFK